MKITVEIESENCMMSVDEIKFALEHYDDFIIGQSKELKLPEEPQPLTYEEFCVEHAFSENVLNTYAGTYYDFYLEGFIAKNNKV